MIFNPKTNQASSFKFEKESYDDIFGKYKGFRIIRD